MVKEWQKNKREGREGGGDTSFVKYFFTRNNFRSSPYCMIPFGQSCDKKISTGCVIYMQINTRDI